MLILTRRVGQNIVIGDELTQVTVLAVRGNQVRIGIVAPREVEVYRQELFERIQQERQQVADCAVPDADVAADPTPSP